MKSLKARLTVAIAGLVAVCVIILTLGSYIRLKTQIEGDLNNEVRGVAAGYNAILSNWIQVNTSMVESLSIALEIGRAHV